MIIATLALLAGCASAPPLPPPDASLFHDEAFAPSGERIAAADVFALSPAMQQFVHARGPNRLDAEDPRRRLIELLYNKRKLALEYDASVTRNAAETFEARVGNCLSLVIMTAAFAKASGLPVDYRSVDIDESWSRDGDLIFASGHVNLALDWPSARTRPNRDLDGPMVVDFLPADELRGLRSRTIGEHTVVAMFMNNRAAEALARGRVDDAYWWAREALRQDSGFLAAYNTLGVVYTHRQQPAWASRVFEQVLAREPGNTKVMGNLARSLGAEGRSGEARVLAARLAAIEPHPPFHFFNAGLLAMKAQDWRGARELFGKEAARNTANHEVHFWLAQAHFNLGDLRAANRHLELARQHSMTQREHALYAGKLDWLRAQRTR